MKQFALYLMIALLCIAILPQTGEAQQKVKLQPGLAYNVHVLPPTDSVSFVKNTIDTLPRAASGWWTNSSTFKVGGVPYVNLELIVKDSCSADIYVERRLPAHNSTVAGSYATVLTDSLINTTNAGTRVVYHLRSAETDPIDDLPYEYRVRISYRNVTMGFSTPYIYPRILWYP